MFIGIDDKAKKVNDMYIGINGRAKKIKYMYLGVEGKAKLFYTNEKSEFLIKWDSAIATNGSLYDEFDVIEDSFPEYAGMRSIIDYNNMEIYDPYISNSFTIKKDQRIEFLLFAGTSSTSSSYIRLYDSNGIMIGNASGNNSQPIILDYTPDKDIKIILKSDTASSTGTYYRWQLTINEI